MKFFFFFLRSNSELQRIRGSLQQLNNYTFTSCRDTRWDSRDVLRSDLDVWDIESIIPENL